MQRTIPRRNALATLSMTCGALLTGTVLGGCSLHALARAVPQLSFGKVRLQVYLPIVVEAGSAQDEWHALLKDAVGRSVQAIGQQVDVSYVIGMDPARWFPAQRERGLSLFNFGTSADSVALPTEDPSLPMPDVAIVPHAWMDGYLAIRAEDLTQHLHVLNATLSPDVTRLGQAFSGPRGTIQAGLPVLRQPMVCRAPYGVAAVSSKGEVWDTDALSHVLQGLSKKYPSGPLANVPFMLGTPPFHSNWSPLTVEAQIGGSRDSGLAAALALNAGGHLAADNVAEFAKDPAVQGLLSGIDLLRFLTTYDYGDCVHPATMKIGDYGVYLGSFARSIGTPATVRTEAGTVVPVSDGLPLPSGAFGPGGAKLLPLPGQRAPAVTLDVMVWKGSGYVDTAAAVAIGLLDRAAQTVLAQWGRALVVDAHLAAQQLARWTDEASAVVLADARRDARMADAYGALTETNLNRQGVIRQDLLYGALQGISKYGGGFVKQGCWPDPKPLIGNQALALLQQAEVAANAGALLGGA